MPAPADIEEHACVNDCIRFTKLLPAQYASARDEACPKCGEARFKKERGHLHPRKRFWHVGLRRVLAQLFADGNFVALRGTGRDAVGDLYTSTLAQQIDEATVREDGGSVLRDGANSCYELCADAGQVFTFRSHSVTLIGIRCGARAGAAACIWRACGAHAGVGPLFRSAWQLPSWSHCPNLNTRPAGAPTCPSPRAASARSRTRWSSSRGPTSPRASTRTWTSCYASWRSWVPLVSGERGGGG